MKKIWYIFDQTYHKGPYTEEEIFTLLSKELIDKSTWVWREGMKEWLAFSECVELFVKFLGEGETKNLINDQKKEPDKREVKREVLPPLPPIETKRVVEKKIVNMPTNMPERTEEERMAPKRERSRPPSKA